jgi:CRISPR-associated endonuclease Csy4
MDHYVDIVLKPDPEMRENMLLNMVCTKLHKALFDLKSNSVGVSYPETDLRLGTRLRIHGKTDTLNQLGVAWLGGLSGYCSVGVVSKVPDSVTTHRTVSRKQLNMSHSKMNRLIKRGSLAAADASRYKQKMFAQTLTAPFLELVSASSGERYRRNIQLGEVQSTPSQGEFDLFGLSRNATIPWF